AEVAGDRVRGVFEVPAGVDRLGHLAVGAPRFEQEELDLGMGVEGEALLGRPRQGPAQHVTRAGPGRAAIGQEHVAEHAGALAADPALEREHLERGRVRHRDHVGLVHPGEALDGRPVEADALLERGLQFGRRHRYALERAEHVGEPQPHETDVALLQGPEHELLLTVHCARSRSSADWSLHQPCYAYDTRPATGGRRLPKIRGTGHFRRIGTAPIIVAHPVLLAQGRNSVMSSNGSSPGPNGSPKNSANPSLGTGDGGWPAVPPVPVPVKPRAIATEPIDQPPLLSADAAPDSPPA